MSCSLNNLAIVSAALEGWRTQNHPLTCPQLHTAGGRLQCPAKHTPRGVALLVAQGWLADMSARPAFASLVAELETLWRDFMHGVDDLQLAAEMEVCVCVCVCMCV